MKLTQHSPPFQGVAPRSACPAGRSLKRSAGLVLLVFVAFTAGMNFLFEVVLQISLFGQVEAMMKAPGLGAAIFVLALLAFDVVLPVPSSLVMVLSGALFGTLAGGALSLAGSLIGNLAGFELMRRWGPSMLGKLVREDEIHRMKHLVERFGSAAILLSRPVPIMMETLTLAAGLLRMNRGSFITGSLVGTVPVTFLYAYAGNAALNASSIVPAIFVLVCLPGAGWLFAQKILRSKALWIPAVLCLFAVQGVAQSADIAVMRLAGSMAVKNAGAFIERDHDRIMREAAGIESGTEQFAELVKVFKPSSLKTDSVGNVLALWEPQPGQGIVAWAAHLNDARTLAAMLGVLRALEAEEIHLRSGLLLIGTPERHGIRTGAMDPILDEYQASLRSLVFVEGREADAVMAAPKTIGSTIVQLALESVMSVGLKPAYLEDLTDRETAFSRRIPSVAIGCGHATAKGVQAMLTMLLAVAGTS